MWDEEGDLKISVFCKQLFTNPPYLASIPLHPEIPRLLLLL